MKIYLIAILLLKSNYCLSCGSDGFKTVNVSKDNPMGIISEIIKDGRILISFPNKFNDGTFSSAYLVVGENKKEDPMIAVSVAPYTEVEYIGISIYLSKEMSEISNVFVRYTSGMLCIAGQITLTGFSELKYSPHWRETDIKDLFVRIEQLKIGMSRDEVRKLLKRPRYESSFFPKSFTKVDEAYALVYYLDKKLDRQSEKDRVVNIVFNNEFELTHVESANIKNYTIPERLLKTN